MIFTFSYKNQTNKYIQYLIIIVFSVILYGNTINNNYSLDDEYVTYKNPKIQKGISGIPRILTSYYSESYNTKFGYRPVTQISYAIEYSIFKQNPYISHFINLLLYILTLLLLLKILKKILHAYNRYLPLIIVLIFAAHPIHTEVVASIKNREEIFSFLFSLLALYQFIIYYTKKKAINIIYGLIFFITAYLSKENSFTFIIIIPLTLFYFYDTKKKQLILTALILIIAGISIRYLTSSAFPGNYITEVYENPLYASTGIVNKIMASFNTTGFYIKLLVFPHPLLFYYGYNTISLFEFNYLTIIAIVSFLIMIFFLIKGFKRKSIYSYAIFYTLISIAFFSNFFFPVNGIVGERLIYQASFGFSILLGIIILKISQLGINNKNFNTKAIRTSAIILILILLPYSYKTIARNNAWKNHYSLYKSDIKNLKKSAKANSLIANWTHEHLNEFNNKKEAVEDIIKYYTRSLSIYKDNYLVANNLGSIYMIHKYKADSAIKYFKLSINSKPKYAKAHFNLAQAYELKKLREKSNYHYKKALSYDNSYRKTLNDLSIKYAKQKYFEQAINLNMLLLENDSTKAGPFYNLANIYLLEGDTVNAITYGEKSYKLNPSNKTLARKLSELHSILGNKEKSEYYLNN